MEAVARPVVLAAGLACAPRQTMPIPIFSGQPSAGNPDLDLQSVGRGREVAVKMKECRAHFSSRGIMADDARWRHLHAPVDHLPQWSPRDRRTLLHHSALETIEIVAPGRVAVERVVQGCWVVEASRAKWRTERIRW